MDIFKIDESKYKMVYGSDFNPSISKACEMANLWTKKGLSDDEVAKGHFMGGMQSFHRLKEVMADNGVQFSELGKLLDFASGFGRTTRFFVQELDSSLITVSDISEEGVDFQKSTFGVHGFYSTADPDDLHHDGKYNAIFANSLFSHLNYEYFLKWLQKLYSFLEPGGHLLFSTHGYTFFKKRPEKLRKRMIKTSPEKGFYFFNANETLGRLEDSYYGTTYVIPGFVKKLVRENDLGEYVKSYNPMYGFMGGQDIYVLRKPL